MIGYSLIIALLICLLGLYRWLFRRSTFILAYHGVGKETSSIPGLVVRPEAFRRHLRLLAAMGLRSVPIDRIVQDISSRRKEAGPRLSITFDDAYRDLLDHALPALAERSWGATIFIPTGHAGSRNLWECEPSFAPLSLLTWEELQDLSRHGISIGSHSHTHRSFLTMPADQIFDDISQSLAELQRRIPGCSLVFSYPFGHRRVEHETIVKRAGFLGACSLVAGAFPNAGQRYDLGRLLVRGESQLLFLLRLLTYPVFSLLRNFRIRLRRA